MAKKGTKSAVNHMGKNHKPMHRMKGGKMMTDAEMKKHMKGR